MSALLTAVAARGKDKLDATAVVHPGATRTERVRAESEKDLAASVSIGRIVDAREVAWVVTFLASPRSVAINGDSVVAGGGSVGPIYY